MWKWLLWSVLYLSLVVLAGYLNVLGHDEDPTLTTLSALLYVGAWIAGALHARLLRGRVRLELASATG